MNAMRQLVRPTPLANGERMNRETFHERYLRMPPNTRAELIGGIVHMPSPLSYDHGDDNAPAVYWLAYYFKHTPGTRVSVNASILLGEFGEPQPDASLRILPERGGRVRHEGGYIVGVPELVVEIAKASLSIDLGAKKADYERAGGLEYLVLDLTNRRIHWHVRRGDRFERLEPRADGCYHSECFPGLILDPEAMFGADLVALEAAVDRGVATLEHAEFVKRLSERRD